MGSAGLRAGSGGLRRKLSTQPRDLSRKPVILITKTRDLDRQPVVLVTKAGVLACKPVVLGREGCHLLLSKPGVGFTETVPWLTYQRADGSVVYGGTPMGPAPRSAPFEN